MEKILIIGAGDFQLPLVRKAAKNYDVLLAAPSVDERFKPFVKDIYLTDVRNKEEILAYAREQKVAGVITDQTDIPVRTIAYVTDALKLPGIGYETGCLFTDKTLMRRRMKQLGLPVLPNQTVFSPDEACAFFRDLKEDVIIKPVDAQGSRGVQACHSEEEIRRKFDEAVRYSSNGGVLVELLARGREFVVEGLAWNYQFYNLCIGDTYYFDLPDCFSARNRIFPTDAPSDLRDRVLDLNRRIVEGFGLKQGITHSEFIMHGEEVYLMETAARGGGVFISSDLIPLSCGLDTEQFLLNIATGKQTQPPQIQEQLCACGYMAFYLPFGRIARIKGLDEVLALPYLHSHQLDKLKLGMVNDGRHSDKTTRLAMIISAPNRSVLDERMKKIRQTLRVEADTPEGVNGLIWA